MSANEDLPVILISAVNAAAASVIISEIIDDGSSPSQCNGAEHGVVWELRNKYYSATVRLLPLADGAAPVPGLDVQAHVIYLTEDECSDAAAWSRRGAAAAPGALGVRLVAARAAHAAPALARWARARHYEVVALQAPAPTPTDEAAAAETRGAARLREALHAHVWPGLRRAGAPRTPPRRSSDSDSSAESESSWGSWVGGDEAEAERAELFAAALAQLPARARMSAQHDGARRLHAEQLVAAFCRALGHELRLDAPAGGDAGGQ